MKPCYSSMLVRQLVIIGLIVSMVLGDPAVLLVGGQAENDVEVIGDFDTANSGSGQLISSTCVVPDPPPASTKGMVGMLDYMDRPMICGGQLGDNHCWYYDSAAWQSGPDMTVERRQAFGVRVGNGDHWLFGGRESEKGTERYDFATNTFITGPPMPVTNVFGGCAAYDSDSGLVFMVFKRFASRDPSKFYSFDPTVASAWTMVGDPTGFTELTDFPLSTRYPTCGMVPDTAGGKVFMVAGGFDIYPIVHHEPFAYSGGVWVQDSGLAIAKYAAGSVTMDSGVLVIKGGDDSNSSQNDWRLYSQFDSTNGEFTRGTRVSDGAAKVFTVAVLTDTLKICPA